MDLFSEPSKILIKKPSKTEEEQDQDFHQMPDVTLREQVGKEHLKAFDRVEGYQS